MADLAKLADAMPYWAGVYATCKDCGMSVHANDIAMVCDLTGDEWCNDCWHTQTQLPGDKPTATASAATEEIEDSRTPKDTTDR